MNNLAIVAENLTYQYGDLTAVDHINFQVGEGEILGFLGPNGAGKSTTVKMLTGQLLPKSGQATLLGLDIAKQTKQIQAKVGVCFENTNLYEEMSALDNLKLFARLYGSNADAGSCGAKRPWQGQSTNLLQRHEAAPDGGAGAGQPATHPLFG